MNTSALPDALVRRDDALSLLRPPIETLTMVAISTLVGLFVAPRWGNGPVDLLFLPAVLFAAGLYGLSTGMLAAVASALAYNFFFTAPYHTLMVTHPQDLATIAMLFLVALVTSQLAARMRIEATNARQSAARNATIAGFARELLSCTDAAEVSRLATREIAQLFGCNAVLLQGGDERTVLASFPGTATLTPSDQAAADWTLESGTPAGRGTGMADAGEWLFFPVWSEAQTFGTLGLARDDGNPVIDAAQRSLLGSLIDQLALALERSRLEQDAHDVNRLKERNQARSNLLATISQEFEPRISAIGQGINRLRRGDPNDKQTLSDLSGAVVRLKSYLTNMLDVGGDNDDLPIHVGGVEIDLSKRLITRDGEQVHLTPKEYAVLAELAKYPDRVLTHAHLLRVAWGPAQEKQVEYLRVAVRALRQKLEIDPANPVLIVNEPSVGYRLKRSGDR